MQRNFRPFSFQKHVLLIHDEKSSTFSSYFRNGIEKGGGGLAGMSSMQNLFFCDGLPYVTSAN